MSNANEALMVARAEETLELSHCRARVQGRLVEDSLGAWNQIREKNIDDDEKNGVKVLKLTHTYS